jgi:L-ascorbate metabolism protein UlaG (beta-lactamase superfamily)
MRIRTTACCEPSIPAVKKHARQVGGKVPAGEKPREGKIRAAAAVTRSSVRRYTDEFWNAVLRRGTPAGDVFLAELDHAAHDGPLAATWLGHATNLLRIGEQWVLTDPVFSERIGLKVGPVTLGMSRLIPAVDPSLLPPIDLILISHAHFDHLDRPSLKQLVSPRTHVITAANTRRLIPRGFGSITELPWEAAVTRGDLTILAGRPKHWGARTAWDRHRGFNSYLIQGPHHRVLYAGDTAYTDEFTKLVGKQGYDLGIFGIGAYDPWIEAHANPEQVWQMHTEAGGHYLLPMHHSTFKLSDEPAHEPLKRLIAAAGDHVSRIIASDVGRLWTPGSS